MPSTIRLHRVLRAPPERVYRAFLDPDAMVKWLPPNGFIGKVYHMDARIGGSYKMSFTNFTTGKSHSFGGEYLELVPHQRICYTDKFDDPNLPGLMHATITFKKVFCGTEVNITQEGVPVSSRPRLAISAGKSPLRFWRNWSRRRFRMSREAKEIVAYHRAPSRRRVTRGARGSRLSLGVRQLKPKGGRDEEG